MKLIRGVVFAVLGVAAFCSTVFAGDVTGNVSVGLFSNDVFRGFERSKDSLSIQPSATVSYKGFSANVLGFDDTDVYVKNADGYGGNNWNETDLTLSYTKTIGMFDLTGGYTYYAYSTDSYNTQEVFVKATVNTFLSPTLSVYRDIDHYVGWYTTLGVSHNITINDKAKVALGAQVGYLSADDSSSYAKVGTDQAYSGFHDGLLSVGVPYAVTSQITVTPVVYYSFALSDAAKDLIKANSPVALNNNGLGGDCDFVYGGVNVAMTF